MYIIGISGSPRKEGNTDVAVKHALKLYAQNKSNQTSFFRIYDYDIKSCLGCRDCMKNLKCIIEDDDFNLIWNEMVKASIVIIGAPVYWYSPPGKMKDFIDRTHGYYASPNSRLAETKFGIITVAADSGFREQEIIMRSWLRHYDAEIMDYVRIFARDKNDLVNRKSELVKIDCMVENL